MTRELAIRICSKEKLHRRDVAKVPEILRGRFKPALPWEKRAMLVFRANAFKRSRHGWTPERFADYCEFDYSQIMKLIKLAEGLINYPPLRHVTSMGEALKILRTERPANSLDAWLIEHEVTTHER